MKNEYNSFSKIISPTKLFFYIWIIAIFLYSLKFSKEVISASFFSVFLIILYAIIIYFFGYSKRNINNNKKLINFSINKRNVAFVLAFCIILLLYEVINEVNYFGTIPFLASFSFDDVNYNDPTYIFKFRHNFFIKSNSIFLAGYCLYLYCITKKKIIFLLIYILAVAVSVLYVSRSTLISIGVITIIIYLSFNRISFKKIFIGLFSLLLIFYLFDKFYFLRNRADINFYINNYVNYNFWESVSRGAQGFYIYLTSPISNLLYNIDFGSFNFFAFHPSLLIRAFIPSKFAYTLFGDINYNTSIVLPGNTNTYTTYPPLLFAFGIIGTILLMIILSILFKKIYQNATNNPSRWFLVLVFLNHIIILSIFSTSIINLVYYFPLFFSYIFPPVRFEKA